MSETASPNTPSPPPSPNPAPTEPHFLPRPVPLPAADAAWVAQTVPLLRAAEVILAHDAERLALVLATARTRKPTVGRDLAAALDAGVDRLTELADQLAEAARRIRLIEVAHEPRRQAGPLNGQRQPPSPTSRT